MNIFRYDPSSVTGYTVVPVANDYVLQKGELKELPTPCFTPMKLDELGNLVSATKEESDKAAEEYLKENGLDTSNKPSSMQMQLSTLSTQIASVQQENVALKAMVQSQSQMIANIKGGKNNDELV